MKKRVVSLMLAVSMVAGLTACGGDAANSSSGSDASAESAYVAEGEEGKVINIYSWNDEFRTRVEAVYDKVDHTSEDGTITYLTDGTEIHWTVNPNQDGVYQSKLDEALMNQATAAADDKVDMFLSETDYVVKYTDAAADVAIPLKDLGIDPDKDLADQYEFTKTVASDANGVQRGSTWQACPCLFVYRRDIAKDAFGTDDPDEIHAKVADWATMKASGEELKSKGYYTLASYADTFRAYGNSISAPWVEEGSTEINVDPQIINWVKDSKEWLDAGLLDKNVKGQWTDDWNKSMGSASKVFGFLLPAWGIDFVLNPNWDGEAGEWAVTDGPQAFNWGGSFIHGCVGTDNAEHVKEIMLAVTGNKDNLMKITKDYLDFTNTQSGMKEIAEDESFGAEFLGGENPFKYFQPAAASIEMTTLSPYDQGCVELIQSSFGDYFQGQVDYDTAKANFEKAIMERYPDITAVNWPE
ncbi:ABC-type glycerol-3-phosphate transport system, substrate-binding protein [Pseudobutyrivibrio sp. ACV-2]|uniref:ABC transporter substrate-binding protein n=1 Tax=Pseudobutyrivibrio sp. ACV-2 TaxID=1520801 RepID=UPI00089B1674|nr:ABC transporter substrate-binding protein [Pseudobutyrivibrio sp. ACV-2]SEA64658.1 ABC-type glycerol-3-phosphate transport system, substrate-binding protein [Pseudobutyrivibrio sp. ACV-2]